MTTYAWWLTRCEHGYAWIGRKALGLTYCPWCGTRTVPASAPLLCPGERGMSELNSVV